jgi:CPA2 family monovalent cation:H+ antiporter-2
VAAAVAVAAAVLGAATGWREGTGLAAGLTVVLLVAIAMLLVAFWRSTTNHEGHVRAGAQVIVEALSSGRQSSNNNAPAPRDPLQQVHALLPGLGTLTVVTIEPTSAANGKTLAELNLRGLTGATVLAITRPSGSTAVPNADDLLNEGDVLTLAGTNEAIDSARILVHEARANEPSA